MLEFVHKLWLTRNDHLHQTDIQNAPSYKKLQLLKEVKDIYQRKQYMLAHDRDVLSNELNSFENKTTDQLNRFLTHCIPIIRQSEKDAKEFGKRFLTNTLLLSET